MSSARPGWSRAVDLERPGAEQGLVEQILVVATGRGRTVDLAPLGAVEPRPAADLGAPVERQLAQHVDPRAHVLAPLVVVGGARQHGQRVVAQGLLDQGVEGARAHAEVVRLAADLVEGDQAVVAVERGVLDRLRHHRPGELLEVHGGRDDVAALVAARADQIRRQRGVQEVEDGVVDQRGLPARPAHRPVEVAPVLRLDAVVGDVGAVDRKARDDVGERLAQAGQREVAGGPALLREAVELVAEDVELAVERVAQDLLLGGEHQLASKSASRSMKRR